MKKLLVSVFALALLVGCGASDKDTSTDKTITVGATPTPHGEILKQVEDTLEEEGYELVVKEFTSYDTLNPSLADGSMDANFFQHVQYLEEWQEKNPDTQLRSVLAVHYEPLGIYSVNHEDLNIEDGAKIAIPNDATNGGRALKLLEDKGIIKLKEGAGVYATKSDVIENPKNVEIIEMAAEACGLQIQDVDYSVVNGNNALNAKISDKLLTAEDDTSDGAQIYKNVLVVREGEEDSEKIQALVKALNTQEVREYIEATYDGIVIPLVPSEE